MKEKINRLEVLLNEIIDDVGRTVQLRNMDVSKTQAAFDNILDEYKEDEQQPVREIFTASAKNLIAEITSAQHDESRFSENILRMKELLENAMIKLANTATNDNPGENSDRAIVLQLLQQNILTIYTPVTASFRWVTYTGHFTEKGYFAVIINNRLHTFSSVSAAASAICRRNTNGWTFWCAVNNNGVKEVLEHFKNRIYKPGD